MTAAIRGGAKTATGAGRGGRKASAGKTTVGVLVAERLGGFLDAPGHAEGEGADGNLGVVGHQLTGERRMLAVDGGLFPRLFFLPDALRRGYLSMAEGHRDVA